MIKKITGLLLATLSLVSAGFFPPTVHSSVKGKSGNRIMLSKSFPVNGMSGVVIHRYGKGLQAITAIAIQTSPGQAVVSKGDLLTHKGLPTPKNIASVGDMVTGGYLYSNVLVLAPNAATYSAITKKASKNWIHPDLFAAYLTREGDNVPTRENLAGFAREAQVGLIYIVQRGRAILLDPVSGRIVGSKSFQAVGSDSRFPFYTRFKKVGGGIFSSGVTSSEGDYYKSIGAIH